MAESPLERAIRVAGPDVVFDNLTPHQRAQLPYDWHAWARPEQRAPLGDWIIWLILAGRGFGKALDINTPVPTPTGWTRMGDLVDGDVVFDERGAVCRVVKAHDVMTGRDCFRVGFSDGTSIVADGEHRWLTTDRRTRKAIGRRVDNPTQQDRAQCRARFSPTVVTTKHIADTVYDGREVNHAIDIAMPLELPDALLPVDPYVLGAWLGDGHSASATLTNADDEIIDIIRQRGVSVGKKRLDHRSVAWDVSLGARQFARGPDGRMKANGSIHSSLRAMGLLMNKYIPPLYLRAGVNQRRELLAGLMDTDGTCSTGGHVEYCGVNERLCRNVLELVRSLGFKPTLSTGVAKLDGRIIGPKYRVTWTPHVPVFRLSRKLARQHTGKRQAQRNRRRYITSVDKVTSVPVRCITVDSLSHLFLAGESMIPTHNTRTGAEWIREEVESGRRCRLALVARTAADVRDVLVEGESGILAISSPDFRPVYEPSKRRLTWPNGAVATTYSADEPNSLRGPQHDGAWADELAAWNDPDAWDQLMFGLRLGVSPRTVVTTTPRPTKLIRELIADPRAVVTRGSTYDNAANLATSALDGFRRKYEGTRLGRQELYAEMLDDVEGALWTRPMLDGLRCRPPAAVDIARVVVGVDPSGGAGDGNDEQGIVVVARGVDGRAYVLADRSCKLSPDGWGRRAVQAALDFDADRIICEKNFGGDMVSHVVKTAARAMNAEVFTADVSASRGKRARAEPIAALYEQGRVVHCDYFPELEDQMTSFSPINGGVSPDRVDALVWAVTALVLNGPQSVATASYDDPRAAEDRGAGVSEAEEAIQKRIRELTG